MVVSKNADSLHSLLADRQYRNTSLGRDTWKSLIGQNASLQLNCNKEGFNTLVDFAKARIGILGNDVNDCLRCDSRIGFGTGGSDGHSNMDDSNTCGNKAAKHFNPDNGEKHIKAMGFILVQ